MLHSVLIRKKVIYRRQSLTQRHLTLPIKTDHPNYVLQPNVALYATTSTEVSFVETPVDMDIYKSDINPFLYISQFKHCQRVVLMPVTSLHKLANEIGSLSGDVVCLYNTARCSSTIFGQLFEEVSSTVLLSESNAMINLSYLRLEGKVTLEEYERLFISIVKVIC